MALNYKRDYARETLIDELLYDNEVEDSLETCYMTEFDRTKRKELADEIYLRLFEENKRWYDAIMAVYLLEKPQKEVAREMAFRWKCYTACYIVRRNGFVKITRRDIAI